jgi:predicted transcriptional regulator
MTWIGIRLSSGSRRLQNPKGVPLHPLNLLERLRFAYFKSMEADFDAALEARIAERANQEGLHPTEFVRDVVAQYLDEEDRFIAAVKRGEAALERGEYLTHERMG